MDFPFIKLRPETIGINEDEEFMLVEMTSAEGIRFVTGIPIESVHKLMKNMAEANSANKESKNG